MAENGSEDSGDKTEEPSQYKIDELRKKGDVASSRELNSVFILAATSTAVVLSSLLMYELFVDYFHYLLSLPLEKAFSEEVLSQILKASLLLIVKSSAPSFLTCMGIGMMIQVAQIGFIYAPDVLEAKWERINPIQGFSRLFSMKSVMEVVKGLLKFIIIIAISYSIFKMIIPQFSGYLHAEVLQSLSYTKWLAFKLFFSLILGLMVVALVDFTYEKLSYRKKIMMTKEQVKQEHKEKEGSPELKQKIKSMQRQLSQKRIVNDVKKANVIVTNPTHLSIAIRYDSRTMIAPVVVAKGADHLALKIREVAKELNIPLVENVPLARALYKTVKTNEAVPRSLYKAMAEVLAFIYKKKNKTNVIASLKTNQNNKSKRKLAYE